MQAKIPTFILARSNTDMSCFPNMWVIPYKYKNGTENIIEYTVWWKEIVKEDICNPLNILVLRYEYLLSK